MIKPKEKNSSLTVRAAWFMAARTMAFAFSFALPLLLVRRLSQDEFGLYKQSFLVVASAITTLPLGFAMSAFYFLPRERERQGLIVFNILLFYIVVGGIACLTLILRPSLLGTIFNTTELTPYAGMIGVVILLWVLSSLIEYIVIANQEAKLASFFIILTQFTKSAILLGAALMFGTVKSLIYAAVIQGGLQTIVLLSYLRMRFGPFWRTFDWAVLRMQLAYSLPLGLAALLMRFHSDLHNYIVSYRFGPSAYAIYSIGCFNFLLVDILTDSVSSVMIPRVSYLQSVGQPREIIELISRMMRKLAAVFLPLYILLLVTGREVLVFLFTSRYLSSWPIFVINLSFIPLALLATSYDPVIRAYAEQRFFLLRIRAVLLVVLLTGLWFATKRYGMVGAISVVVAVGVMERVATVWRSARVLGAGWPDLALFKDVAKIGAASLVAGLFAFLARTLVIGAKPFFILLVCGVVFSLVYLASLLLLGVVTLAEREAIRRIPTMLQRYSPWRRAAAPLAWKGEGTQ